jgi:5'-nucleotidase
MMKILLTNDDGIHAPGLWVLYDALSVEHAVTVIAPDRERTAVSHAITLHQPLRTAEIALNGRWRGHAVSGTPADCVKLGILEIMGARPDLVVAGINPGANLGINVNYSGTVAAAREGALCGIPAIAASIEGRPPHHYETAAGFVVRLTAVIQSRGLQPGTFLNVNFPNVPRSEVAGVRISRHGLGGFRETMEKRVDPREQVYFWQGADMQLFGDDPEVDGAALRHRFVSITPMSCDMTDYRLMEEMVRWWGISTEDG